MKESFSRRRVDSSNEGEDDGEGHAGCIGGAVASRREEDLACHESLISALRLRI